MKSKNKSTKSHGFIAVIVVLALLCGVLAIGVVSTASTAASYSYNLENVYKRSFYELGTNINDIEVALSKVLASNDTASQSKLMEEIYENCTVAVSNLSRLPLSQETLNQTTKFLNQMGGYSYSLSKSLKAGTKLTQENIDKLNELYNTSIYIQQKVSEFEKNNNGSYNILKTSKQNKTNSFGSLFDGFKQKGTEYPTLIYDGPFADSKNNKNIENLSSETISQQQAMDKITTWLEGSKEVKSISENKGKFDTYNFTFKDSKNRDCYAQVSKNGGLLLNYDSYCITKQDNFSLKDLEKKAEEFASKMELEVKAVWSTKLNGVAYINLTSMDGDTVIYPEMIKVKACTDTGDIVGWEAQSYAINHKTRKIDTPKLTKAQAMEKVSGELTIDASRLCVIPQEFKEDALCYEFICTKNNTTYYVYIDANTGSELNILRVVSTVSGDMII